MERERTLSAIGIRKAFMEEVALFQEEMNLHWWRLRSTFKVYARG